jgi:NAD(P)-dependent dehydrogenase (short-subunit alcohol dehydrogenase family)
VTQARIVLVTGGGRGIGAAVARAFATRHRVFLVSRTGAELDAVAAGIREAGGTAAYAEADVSDRDDVARAVEACAGTFGMPDVLVNAAGVYGPIGLLWQTDLEAWWRAQEINVKGTVLTSAAVIPHMIEAGWGRIINFSGGGATSPLPRFSAYAAGKAAVVRMTETLAEELREHAITVNAIAPGAVDTRLQDEVLAAGERAGDLHGRMQRLRDTGEGGVPPGLAADLAVFLASDAAAAVTGKLISAPHDGWQDWDESHMELLCSGAWFTLRRIDAFTLRPLVAALSELDA